jgi:hypothetical protein
MMDRIQEDIALYELMLRGRDPEQKAQAYGEFQKIARQQQGTPSGQQAKLILDEIKNQNQMEEKDPEWAAFSRRWDEIQGLTDVRLPKLLRDLQAKPTIAAPLRRDVIKGLRQWIIEVKPKINMQTSLEEIQRLDSFVSMLSQLETYEDELEELKPLRHALFEVRCQRVEQEIKAALSNWSFDEAWAALRQLSNPPPNLKGDFERLQEMIYNADQTRKEVCGLFDKAPKDEWKEWTESAYSVKYMAELSGYLRDDVPQEQQERLRAKFQQCARAIVRFLETIAADSRELQDVRDFQASYEQLNSSNGSADAAFKTEWLEANFPLKREWFKNALNSLAEKVEQEISMSDSPEALDAVCQHLLSEQHGLPGFLIEEMKTLGAQIEDISASWKAIRTGDDFTEPTPWRANMPAAYINAVEFFRERLNRINEAFEKLKSSDRDAGQAYAEAALTADEILNELGEHALARKLKEEAERKISYYQIDRAMAEWQIERLLELCRLRAGEPACGYFILNERTLQSLGTLVKAPPFSGWHRAEGWWQLWRMAYRELQPSMPDALRLASQREQEKRADQWHAVLGELSKSQLSPEECEAIAASLKAELANFDLQWRQRSFLRKAVIGYAERFIKKKEWARVEEQIAELDEDHEETGRLRTLLAVERSRETGLVALSKVLMIDWAHVSMYLKDEAYSILSEAVEQAWERRESEALKDLIRVVSRVVSTADAPPEPLKNFARWEEWLAVEDAVVNDGEMAAVKKLVSYLEANSPPDPRISRWLQRLVEYWRNQKDKVMLAWASEAFRGYLVKPVRHPAEDLTDESDEVAAHCENILRSNAQLQLPELKTLQSGLERNESGWARLKDYLNELSHAETLYKPSDKFYKAKNLLVTLSETWTTLEQLKGVDFRRDAEREKLQACSRTLKGKLDGVAVQAKLLEQVERLEPLTRLPFLQNRVMEAADKCGSDVEWDEKNLFGVLSQSLSDFIQVFLQAGAKGGPLWRVLSVEYGDTLPARAGSLLPKPNPPDLSELVRHFESLEVEEEPLKQLWQDLWSRKPTVPSGGSFEPEAHLNYLKRFPKEPPHSRRGYLQFKRSFAMIEPMPTILTQSRRNLPEWICKYLDEGIPQHVLEP